jgi:hypothetical protein
MRWPRDNLYPQKLALTSPKSGGRSVGIVRLRTTGHGALDVKYNENINTKTERLPTSSSMET